MIDVRMKLFGLEILTSYLNVSRREKARTKYDVSIVKIPRIVISGPKDRVATWVMFLPRTPMTVAEKRM